MKRCLKEEKLINNGNPDIKIKFGEKEFLEGGKSPSSVREMMKQKSAQASGNDPKTKLEREKSRLEKTIAQLTQRLEYVEESLASL